MFLTMKSKWNGMEDYLHVRVELRGRPAVMRYVGEVWFGEDDGLRERAQAVVARPEGDLSMR